MYVNLYGRGERGFRIRRCLFKVKSIVAGLLGSEVIVFSFEIILYI